MYNIRPIIQCMNRIGIEKVEGIIEIRLNIDLIRILKRDSP